MIDEDELDVEDVAINDNDNVQEEDENEKVLNIVEENREPVNERGIYITKEEDNNEVDNNYMKDNEDNNRMN